MLQFLGAQEHSKVVGIVKSSMNKDVIKNVFIEIVGTGNSTFSAENGTFQIILKNRENLILQIVAKDYVTKNIPIVYPKGILDLGSIYLEPDIRAEKSTNLISLTDSDLADDQGETITSGILQATKDIFLNRAAFDFGQAFFRVRGYDSQNGEVLINGLPMNKLIDGRPQWNNWGGLNDVTRNQEFSFGLAPASSTFGGILGTTNIDTRPSNMRSGLRLSSSTSNRTYSGRFMATYTSRINNKGITYSISSSRRWAKSGYANGTLYDAFSVFGALEYQLNKNHHFLFTAFLASNRRGSSSAITEEVFNMTSNKYNPYWGNQNGKNRNSRERKIQEPLLLFNHFYKKEKLQINTGIFYQLGDRSKSRLGYYNAPNPYKTYYRYLPSFYINSPIGANFYSANKAKEDFLLTPQIDWDNLYTANLNSLSGASYILYNDVIKDKRLVMNSVTNFDINEKIHLDLGAFYQNLRSTNYARIEDLLGANFHRDIDAFSGTLNNVDGNNERVEGDTFNYNYVINASKIKAFGQLKYKTKNWNAFFTGSYAVSNFQREGLFKNQRFITSSLGKSEKTSFSTISVKMGFTYKFNGRNWITVKGAIVERPPTLQNIFINPRENNLIVPNLEEEKVTSLDMSYFIRLPKLTARITGFHTLFRNTTDVNFFYVDAGVGSDFVQEVLTGVDKLHLGTEIGLEYQLSSSVRLTGVLSLAKYTYASNPNVSINFDTADAEEELINTIGRIDLGSAKLKNYRLAQGPQKALALGIDYRDPKYWWVGLSANYMGDNYANISTITRTDSFSLDPETGEKFADATEENVERLLAQKPLDDFYLLNAIGGKSWLRNGKYISVFVSLNNIFNSSYRTGGYEQSRNGNYGQLKKDNLSGSPSFAPKYWYGYGRTYFLNFAISF
ncbi:TonB-dependent receptor [uncultured Maribacter sp.]|uniref:TonB-dependent receptor n=1 Tax=uncultured Maribacter sp. TaxID=431308 RepID=UPI0026393309|nr:TonB-dependent receptor [uncultured Maribacter sp.]